MTQTPPPPAQTIENASRAGKPLTHDELEQARRWRTAGSSITAIAKHLQRSRGTIKAYLDGVRAPGHRRKPPPRADPFPAFADYCWQRLTDDPHLETRPLHRELVKLGYPGSYQALWRHLQANSINTSGCPDCRQTQKPSRPTATSALEDISALPAFGSHDLSDPVRATHACHKCLAAKGIRHQIPVHMPGHQHICLRHRLWIGPAGIPQLDLTACPAITRAQHHAHHLTNRFGAKNLIFAQLAAERETRNMPYRPTPDPPRHHWRHRLQRLRNTNPQADTAITHDQFIRAALYPDAIARAAKALDNSKIY